MKRHIRRRCQDGACLRCENEAKPRGSESSCLAIGSNLLATELIVIVAVGAAQLAKELCTALGALPFGITGRT